MPNKLRILFHRRLPFKHPRNKHKKHPVKDHFTKMPIISELCFRGLSSGSDSDLACVSLNPSVVVPDCPRAVSSECRAVSSDCCRAAGSDCSRGSAKRHVSRASGSSGSTLERSSGSGGSGSGLDRYCGMERQGSYSGGMERQGSYSGGMERQGSCCSLDLMDARPIRHRSKSSGQFGATYKKT